MKTRSLEYEKKFRKYLYSFDFKTHKEIIKALWIDKISIGLKK